MTTPNRMPSGNIDRATATLQAPAVDASTEALGAVNPSLASAPSPKTRSPSRVAANPQLAATHPLSDDDALKPISAHFGGVLKMARPT